MRVLLAFLVLTFGTPLFASREPASTPLAPQSAGAACEPKATHCPWNVCGQIETGCGPELECRTGCYLLPVVAAGATALAALLFLLIR